MADLQLEFVRMKMWQDQRIGLPITFLMTVAGRYTAMLLLNGRNISNSPKSVACNSQLGSPWRGKIHQDQPLLQQHTTAATFDIAAGTAGLAQHL